MQKSKTNMEEVLDKDKEQDVSVAPASQEDVLEDALAGLPTDRKEQIKGVVVAAAQSLYSSSYQGPLPHPTHFAGYESVLPGAAERILAMAEKQQESSIKKDRTVDYLLRLGMWLFIIVFLGSCSLAAYAVYEKAYTVAISMVGAAVLIAIVLVLRRNPKVESFFGYTLPDS